jgi:predicted DNA-binding antitoxin AbrB/MazE fold protein
MTMTVDAVYENGVLRPKVPLELIEGQQVRLTVSSTEVHIDSDAEFTALASEESLSRIWDNPEEDAAWADL